MVKKTVARVYRDGVELVIVESTVLRSQTAVHDPSLELRDSVVVGT